MAEDQTPKVAPAPGEIAPTAEEEPPVCRNCATEDAEPGKDLCEECDSEESRASANADFESLPIALLTEDQLAWLVVNSLRELSHRKAPVSPFQSLDAEELHKQRQDILKALQNLQDDEDRALIKKARKLYAHPSNNNLEIDDNATISEGDGGKFVAAWVWVPSEKLDCQCAKCEDDDCEGCSAKRPDTPSCAEDCPNEACRFQEKAQG